jgi:hypothetical protein
MEKGLKNMTQAARSAQKKQNDGTTYHEEDSGIGISDLDEESSPADMLPSMADAHSAFYPGGYPSQQQRVPSIQSMIHPTHQHQQHASQYIAHQHQHQIPHAHMQQQHYQ